MLRVIYNLPNADPQMDGLEWTEDRGELISPELTQEAYDRYLTIPGFRAAELPKPPAPVQPVPVPPAQPEPPAASATPAASAEGAGAGAASGDAPKTDAPPATDAAKPPTGQRARGAAKPATDAGTTAGDTQKE